MSLMFASKAGAFPSDASYCAQALLTNILLNARVYVTGKQKQTSLFIESKAGAFPS